MRLKTGNGIKCDLCESEHADKFTYYSYSVQECHVVRNEVGARWIKKKKEYDICQSCYDLHCDTVVKHYKPTRSGLNCDMCGKHMNGNFIFYRCKIDKIIVDLDNDINDVLNDELSIDCCNCIQTTLKGQSNG